MRLEDLQLDVPTLGDVPALHAIYGDPRVWTHLPSGRHRDIRQTREMVRGWIDAWARDGLSYWIVRAASSQELLGHVGCSARRGAFWNLGYRIAFEAHGRGIATLVGRRAVDEAHRTDSALPVVAYLLEHNRASARVAEKLGLTLQHRGPDSGNPDPHAVRLVYADRPLTAVQRDAVMP
jgi:RimJ/RimL family protein N-acetyltransferase